MSTKSVKEFLDKIAQDESLRDELTNAVKGSDDKDSAAAEVAARHGFEFESAELKRILDAAQGASSAEMTEEELEAVAAGLTVFQQIRFAPPYVPVGH
jgi:predicted ribosomally synthesized peptide with nif11-like leader